MSSLFGRAHPLHDEPPQGSIQRQTAQRTECGHEFHLSTAADDVVRLPTLVSLIA